MASTAQQAIQKLLKNVAIVLVAPKYPENVGAAARAAMNMGVAKILLVSQEMPDDERMRRMATHNAAHLIDGIERYDSLAEALAPFGWVLGTSARQGKKRSAIRSPRQVMDDLLPRLKNNKVAFVFGPEDRGLVNEDLKLCNQITTIPTADFSSLNLAQSVAILCHELHYAVLDAVHDGFGNFVPRQAQGIELEAMYDHVEEMLQEIGFFQGKDSGYWMNSIRHFLGRIGLKSKETQLVRGFCRQLLRHQAGSWEEKKRQKD